MEIFYALIIGIVLCLLSILMKLNWLRFLIDRYEVFQKAIRKKKISVDKEEVSKFYSILFFITGIPLLIGVFIGFIKPDLFRDIYIWIFITVVVLGVIGILYLNLSNRFIKPLENS